MAFLTGFSGAACKVITATLNPASVTNATLSVQTFDVDGLAPTDFIVLNMPGLAAASDVKPIFSRVSAIDTLEISFYNFGSSPVNLGATTVHIIALGAGSAT
jgi:hypothetical protein